jgi:murein DD-endopeptidase MepM/ murein hydrolase activator NlpD
MLDSGEWRRLPNLATAVRAFAGRLTPAAEILLYPMSSLLLMHSAWVGLGMWLVLLQEPRLALVAAIALCLGEPLGRVAARVLREQLDPLARVNMLLGALVAGWLTLPAPLPLVPTALTIAAIQVLALLATFLMRRVLAGSGLPALILPYCLVASMVFTLAPLAVYGAAFHFQWPHHELTGVADLPLVFLQSMGVFLFSPSAFSGALIVVMLALYSPVMLLAGLLGWLSGALTAFALVNLGIIYAWELTSYNYFLAGMAVGAAFFIPGWGSQMAALLAGSVAALIAAYLQNFFAVPGLSILPFTFVMSLFVTLTILQASSLQRSKVWLDPPEDRLVSSAWLAARWGDHNDPLLALPVQGPLVVTQGFDGAITHRDSWRHALDLERPGGCDNGASGIWGTTVYPPVTGTIVEAQTDIFDNQTGVANYGDNWGNYVLIQADAGYYVLLAHLMQGSILVTAGQRVGFKTPLALVGNSGRSLVPHLHMQAQQIPVPGAPTIPFRVANFIQYPSDGLLPRRWHAAGIPLQGQIVGSSEFSRPVHDLLTSISPGRSIWTVEIAGEAPGWFRRKQPLVVTTALAADGSYVLTDAENNRLEARLEVDGWRVLSVSARPGSLLATLAAGMATVPYGAFSGLVWNDVIPRCFPPFVAGLHRKLAPWPQGKLQHLRMLCLNSPVAPGENLLVQAYHEGRHAYAPETSEVEIAAWKGPIRASWTAGQVRVSYSAVTFTSSTT